MGKTFSTSLKKSNNVDITNSDQKEEFKHKDIKEDLFEKEINAELDKLVRNQDGKVIASRVLKFMENKNCDLNQDPINELENSDALQDINSISDEKLLEILKIDTDDKLRINIWKKITRVNKRDYGRFSSYEEICKVPISDQNKECINIDLPRIISDHPYYSEEYGEGRKILRRFFKSICAYYSEIGYLCSFGYLSSTLLLYMNEEDAFLVFKYFMENEVIYKWISQNNEYLKETMYTLQKLCCEHLNEIYITLRDKEVSPIYYSSSWFLSLYSSRFLYDSYYLFLDRLLIDGYSSCYKLALAILEINNNLIVNSEFDEILGTLAQRIYSGDVTELFNKYDSFTISNDEINLISAEYTNNPDQELA